jgi:hypothetical protein
VLVEDDLGADQFGGIDEATHRWSVARP